MSKIADMLQQIIEKNITEFNLKSFVVELEDDGEKIRVEYESTKVDNKSSSTITRQISGGITFTDGSGVDSKSYPGPFSNTSYNPVNATQNE